MGGASTTATADFRMKHDLFLKRYETKPLALLPIHSEEGQEPTAAFRGYCEGVEEAGDGRTARTGTCPI